jgi:hypothetical protein
MKKEIEWIIIISISIVVGLFLVAQREIRMTPEPRTTIADEPAEMPGADSDEQGCKASAGYSWCGNKNKCLRVWEEECFGPEEIKSYINEHLAELSPIETVLGGKFYVTNIMMEGPNVALVDYEDGHIAVKARATIGIENGELMISQIEEIKD